MFPLMYFIKEVFIIEKEKKYPGPEFSFYLFILSRSQSCFYKGENDLKKNTGDTNTGSLKNGRQT